MTTIELDNPGLLAEKAQAAYMAGDTVKAALYDRIVELMGENVALREQIADTWTLADWEKQHGSAEEYKQFFYDCFERLAGHYPCPSIGSDRDKAIIFEAIEKGESV